MRSIFISYRREDAEGQAGRLFDDLTAQFGENSVFMDVVDIEPGRDFRRVIDQHVASCAVLLAVIGKRWVDAKDQAGRRRLDNPNDFVRLETASALKRDIPVIPVLVQGAGMPQEEQLPEDLKEFAFRNAVELTHARWDSDVQILIKALGRYIGVEASPQERASPKELGDPLLAPIRSPGTSRTEEGPQARTIGPTVAPQSRKIPWRATLVASVAVIALLFGAYKIYDHTQKVAEEQKAAASKAAADRAAAENAAAEQKAAASKAAADRAAAEKTAAAKAAREKPVQAARSVSTPVPSAPPGGSPLPPLYITDSLAQVGRIYRVESDRVTELYTRPRGRIYGVAVAPDGTTYFSDADNRYLYRFEGSGEVSIYTHTTYLRYIAFDGSGRLHFSEASGAKSDGVIYRLEGSRATRFYTVPLAEVDGFWAGNFAFDPNGVLWLSSGILVPARLYKVVGSRAQRVFTSSGGPVNGFTFTESGDILFAAGRQGIHRLALRGLQTALVFSSETMGISDVKVVRR